MTFADALRLGRVSNLPTVWSNVLAALVLAGAGAVREPLLLAVLLLALSLFYTAGMYLNDFFDRALDARERPERPTPRGRVRATTVLWIGLAQLTAGLGLVVTAAVRTGRPGPALASALGLAAGIVLYDVWHKKNPASPLLMGLCRALVYPTAALAAGARLGPVVLLGAAILFLYIVALSVGARRRIKGVAVLIAGISLVDAVLMAALAPGPTLVPILAAAVCFGLTVFLQKVVPGT